jgi:hypothetical protein
MENPAKIHEGIVKVMDALKETGYIATWIGKEHTKDLRTIVRAEYPDARIEKLSGTETHFILVSIK